MTFLTPIAGLIAGAIAIPTLLLYYFLKLRRQPIRVSSTLLWVQATKDLQVNVPLRMIRASWLLLIQMLALLLLVAAIARPALHMDEAPASRVVILIDASASMGARDGPDGQTRLEQARARAIELVNRGSRVGSSSRVMVVAFAAQARAVTTFTQDRGALREAIAAIEQTDQPGRLAPALELASAAIATDVGEESREEAAEVIVLSDGSFAESTGSLAIPGARARYEPMGERLDEESRDNLGVVAISARRDYDDPGLMRVFVRVQSAARDETDAAMLLALDGEEVARVAVNVPGRDARGTPGQSAQTFELRSPGGGVATVVLSGRDLLAADNAGGVVLDPPLRPAVLVVVREGDGALESPPRGPSTLLIDALREIGLSRLRVVSTTTYEATLDDAQREHDLIVFVNAAPRAMPARPSLSFGAVGAIEGVSQRADARPTGFVVWQRAHPVLRDVSLDGVHIARPTPMTIAPESDGVRGVELASGMEGVLIALIEDRVARRVVVSFDLAQSTWPAHFGFPIFLSNSIEFLASGGTGEVGRAFRTDEAARVRTSGAGGDVRLIPPAAGGGDAIIVRAGSSESRRAIGGELPVGIVPLAGVYRVEGALDTQLAINMLDEHESRLAVVETLDIGGETLEAATGEREPREIWPWFVTIALGLLIVEWFLSASLMRV